MYHIFKFSEYSWEPLFSTPLKRKALNYAKGMSFRYITKVTFEDQTLATYYMGSDYVDETV